MSLFTFTDTHPRRTYVLRKRIVPSYPFDGITRSHPVQSVTPTSTGSDRGVIV